MLITRLYKTIRLAVFLFLFGILPLCVKAQDVTEIEYFFDADPGTGNGTKLLLNAAKQIDTTVIINMGSLTLGLHRLFIRTKDSDNNWSLYYIYPVLNVGGTTPVLLKKMEYFFDTDPRLGNGISVNLPAAMQTDTTINLDLSSITTGLHQVFIRTMDNTGKWSLYRTYSVIKGPGYYEPLTVNQFEYFFNADPGVGKGIPVDIGPAASFDGSIVLPIPDTITTDSIHIFIRARDNRGLWGLYHDTTVPVTCNLFVIAPPHIGYAVDSCGNKVVTFTDTTQAAQWKWNFSNGDSASGPRVTYHFPQPGNYNVSHYIINRRGCISDTIIHPVTVQPPLSVNAGPDQEIYPGETLTLTPQISGNDSIYLWSPNNYINNATIRNPTLTGVADITYTISVTGKGNCKVSDTVAIKINRSTRPVEIPNAFSPNGDGVNDTWLIKNLHTYTASRVQVYNRYGQLVFESTGYSTPWNGKMRGNPLPFGTYYYIINLNNGQKPRTGSISIIY